jgi:hypothetical protein
VLKRLLQETEQHSSATVPETGREKNAPFLGVDQCFLSLTNSLTKLETKKQKRARLTKRRVLQVAFLHPCRVLNRLLQETEQRHSAGNWSKKTHHFSAWTSVFFP